MVTFFTFRYFYHDNYQFTTPKMVIMKNFSGITSLKYEYIIGNLNKDGRHLAKIEYDPNEIPLEIISEALQMYSFHEKTEESALEFFKILSGDSNATLDPESKEFIYSVQTQ